MLAAARKAIQFQHTNHDQLFRKYFRQHDSLVDTNAIHINTRTHTQDASSARINQLVQCFNILLLFFGRYPIKHNFKFNNLSTTKNNPRSFLFLLFLQTIWQFAVHLNTHTQHINCTSVSLKMNFRASFTYPWFPPSCFPFSVRKDWPFPLVNSNNNNNSSSLQKKINGRTRSAPFNPIQ